MTPDANKCFLVGTLVRDPEMVSVTGKTQVVRLRVQTCGPEGAPLVPIAVTCFGGLARNAVTRLRRGFRVRIEAYLRPSRYERAGELRYSLDVIARALRTLEIPKTAQSSGLEGQKQAIGRGGGVTT